VAVVVEEGKSIVEGFVWAGLELNDENCDGVT
jgi:hypothetical protein